MFMFRAPLLFFLLNVQPDFYFFSETWRYRLSRLQWRFLYSWLVLLFCSQ